MYSTERAWTVGAEGGSRGWEQGVGAGGVSRDGGGLEAS